MAKDGEYQFFHSQIYRKAHMPGYSLERFGQFYPGEGINLPSDINRAVGELNDIGLQTRRVLPNEVFESYGSPSLLDGLVQALRDFPGLLANISIKATDFVESLKDQVAAGELLTRFGVPIFLCPESLLVVPVFAELMSREVLSKLEASQVAGNLSERVIKIRAWIQNFICLLQLQALALEQESTAHQQAKVELSQVTTAGPQVDAVKIEFGGKLNQQVGSISRQQHLINQAIASMTRILESIEGAGRPIVNVSHQFLTPSLTI